MHKTLVINAHPDYRHRGHKSTALEDYFVTKLKETFPESQITVHNLYGEDIPQIDESSFAIYSKEAAGIDLTENEKRLIDHSRELLEEFKEHHRIVITAPLHNFNINSRLKDYLDTVLVARETYRYTAEGSVGMMTNDYKALYIQSSGSVYTNNDRYTPLEFSTAYLREMFVNIMGFDHFDVVRVQGTDILGADQISIMDKSKAEIDAIFEGFYK